MPHRTPTTSAKGICRADNATCPAASGGSVSSRVGNAGMQVLMRQAVAANAGHQTQADVELQERRISTFIGDDPVIVKRTTPIGASGHSVVRWVLSGAAKSFLGRLLRELYRFPLDLDDIIIRFVRQSGPAPFGGEYDAQDDSINLDVDQWNSYAYDRTAQLEIVVHELVHAYQRRAFKRAPTARERDHQKDMKRRDNYVLPQNLMNRPFAEVDPLDPNVTEDQLAQRVMYEVAVRTGDPREFTDHWRVQKLPPKAPKRKER